MNKGSEVKGLSVNTSYLGLLFRMHVNPGLRHSNKIQGYAWNLAFLLQCLGCYRCFFFTSGFCITGMSPCWIQVEFWDSGSSVCVLISGVWRISARGVRKCLKHRGCFTQNLHCQKNTLPRAALWRIPDKQCSWISDLRRPSSCWWVQKTLLLWAMPGVGWQGRMLSVHPLHCAQLKALQSKFF